MHAEVFDSIHNQLAKGQSLVHPEMTGSNQNQGISFFLPIFKFACWLPNPALNSKVCVTKILVRPLCRVTMVRIPQFLEKLKL